MLGWWIALALFGFYVFLSVIFLCFPTVLHKKKKNLFLCKHISHRGGAGEQLENTMTAFHHALKQGTEMLEIDLQLSLDEQVVICHDNNLRNLTGEDVCISGTNYVDLPPLKSKLSVMFQPNTYVIATNNDQKIPLLRAAFQRFPNVYFNIELKGDNDKRLVTHTISLIDEFNMSDKVCLGSGSHKLSKEVAYQLPPNKPMFFSFQRVVYICLSFYVGLLPFIPIRETCLEIPLIRSLSHSPDLPVVLRIFLHIVGFLLTSRVLFWHLQQRGIRVYLWVVNDKEDFKYCFEKLNVDGVMTDYPTKLTNYLNHQKS